MYMSAVAQAPRLKAGQDLTTAPLIAAILNIAGNKPLSGVETLIAGLPPDARRELTSNLRDNKDSLTLAVATNSLSVSQLADPGQVRSYLAQAERSGQIAARMAQLSGELTGLGYNVPTLIQIVGHALMRSGRSFEGRHAISEEGLLSLARLPDANLGRETLELLRTHNVIHSPGVGNGNAVAIKASLLEAPLALREFIQICRSDKAQLDILKAQSKPAAKEETQLNSASLPSTTKTSAAMEMILQLQTHAGKEYPKLPLPAVSEALYILEALRRTNVRENEVMPVVQELARIVNAQTNQAIINELHTPIKKVIIALLKQHPATMKALEIAVQYNRDLHSGTVLGGIADWIESAIPKRSNAAHVTCGMRALRLAFHIHAQERLGRDLGLKMKELESKL